MKRRTHLVMAAAFWLFASQMSLVAQEEHSLRGDLRADLFRAYRPHAGTGGMPSEYGGEAAGKSPFRAALYSLAVPGLGQVYAEDYVPAAGFLAGEVALWVLYAVYEQKGDRQTEEFERFADEHWSVVRYAEWMALYGPVLNPDVQNCSGIVIGTDPRIPPWERVDWDVLNRCEESIGRKASTGFSHRLPRRPEQQYYELIGKYEQYNPGWDDAGVTDIDYLTRISARFLQYRDMRGRANDLYSIAGTAALVLVANHVTSALHAAWSASRYNRDVRAEVHLVPVRRPFGLEFVPTASLTVRF